MATKFNLGNIVATPGALDLLERKGVSPGYILKRHVSGDWGDMDPEDKKDNELALKHGDRRLMSSYILVGGDTVWVLTEHDRSVTTILTPDEY